MSGAGLAGSLAAHGWMLGKWLVVIAGLVQSNPSPTASRMARGPNFAQPPVRQQPLPCPTLAIPAKFYGHVGKALIGGRQQQIVIQAQAYSRQGCGDHRHAQAIASRNLDARAASRGERDDAEMRR